MNENAKIVLSAKELELVCNTDWILTKQAIIQKVYQLFGNLVPAMQQLVNNHNNTAIKKTNPKISKGESYQQLPYVMLDYPRLFEKENTASIRTFFWWGNEISIHLLVSGESKDAVVEKIFDRYEKLQHKNYFVCINDSPWEHHFRPDNYLTLKSLPANTLKEVLHRKTFIKIGKKIQLEEWDEATNFINISFEELIELLDN